MFKRISILGSTGSIGVNALKVASHLREELEIVYLSANQNTDLLIEQALQFNPEAVCIVDEEFSEKVKDALISTDIEVNGAVSIIVLWILVMLDKIF